LFAWVYVSLREISFPLRPATLAGPVGGVFLRQPSEPPDPVKPFNNLTQEGIVLPFKNLTMKTRDTGS
jgi:hypothetical protein